MRRRLAKVASTLLAALFLTSGGAFLATASAQAETAHRADVVAPAAVWVDYKNYATYEACRQQGREMLGGGVVIAYECSWDSPYWLLRVRIE
ncbi:hypothetical protein HD597_012405 [Nonomuraea thailandensis]|uniref:Secreted protein n=1 Tax=Nonomuraea thailandensis TaxID=1188745 RepID=A0A9X2GWS8_9ACTN|nr:hypothetical protein [Nonomuraea thailandensis]MCP2365385.1 hypothetical protein [Nonomuraea thailandensis]